MGKIDDLIAAMGDANGAYAYLLQETHLYGKAEFEYTDGEVLVTSGKDRPEGVDGTKTYSGSIDILILNLTHHHPPTFMYYNQPIDHNT